MTRRKPQSVEVDSLPPPAVIAREIAADLRSALREFEAVAKALERPSAATAPPDGEQLAIDL